MGGALVGAAGARPSWSGLFSLLPAACGAVEVLSGQSGRPSRGVLSPPSPCHRPVPKEVTASAGSQEASHQACPRKEAPKGSRLEAGLPGTTPISGKPWVLALLPRATVCPQSFSHSANLPGCP